MFYNQLLSIRWHFRVLWLFLFVHKRPKVSGGEERFKAMVKRPFCSLPSSNGTRADFSAEFMSDVVFVKISTFFVPVCLDKNTSFACIGYNVRVGVLLAFCHSKWANVSVQVHQTHAHIYTTQMSCKSGREMRAESEQRRKHYKWRVYLACSRIHMKAWQTNEWREKTRI